MGNKKGLVISSLIILVIAIIAVTYLLFQEKKEKSDMTQLFDLEKEEMENEYTRLPTNMMNYNINYPTTR